MDKEDVDLVSLNLIKRGGKDREEGVCILYEKYARTLMSRFLYRTRIQADAEDLVQETFIKIIKGCETYKGNAPVALWIGRIAKNCLIDYLRTKKIHPIEGLDDEQWEFLESELEKEQGQSFVIEKDEKTSWLLKNHNNDPSEELETVEKCVKNAFARFAKEDRARANALSLVVEGHDIKSISSLINRTEGATREYLSQCRKKIEKYMLPCKKLLAA